MAVLPNEKDYKEATNFLKINEMDFYDVMDLALTREKGAYKLYLSLSNKMRHQDAKETLQRLAQEELEHVGQLEKIIDQGPESLQLKKAQKFSMIDAHEQKYIDPLATVGEILLYAINQENSEYIFYKNMAKRCQNKENKDIFVKLSRLELEHRNRLEKIYLQYFSLKDEKETQLEQ